MRSKEKKEKKNSEISTTRKQDQELMRSNLKNLSKIMRKKNKTFPSQNLKTMSLFQEILLYVLILLGLIERSVNKKGATAGKWLIS